MSKFETISENFKNKFEDVLSKTSIPQYVEFVLLNNEKSKIPYSIKKANDVLTHLVNCDFVIIVNEKIFDTLDEDLQIMMIDEMLSVVEYNSESDRLSLGKFDVSTNLGFLRKYGIDSFGRYVESINAIIKQEEEKEEEEKNNKPKKGKGSY